MFKIISFTHPRTCYMEFLSNSKVKFYKFSKVRPSAIYKSNFKLEIQNKFTV